MTDLPMQETDCSCLDDDALTRRLQELVRSERGHLVELIIHLTEFDGRKLYAAAGYRSLYLYCTLALGYSEQAAYLRINASRMTTKFPAALALLRLGRLHLAALLMLSPHLTKDNHARLLVRACGKSKRELEILLAPFEPGRKVPDRIWHIAAPQSAPAAASLAQVFPSCLFPAVEGSAPAADKCAPAAGESAPMSAPTADTPAANAVSPGLPSSVSPLPDAVPPSSARPVSPPAVQPAAAQIEPQVRISFSASEDFFRKLEKARGVLRHKHPSGRLEEVFDEALDALLDVKDPDRLIAAKERRRAARERRSAEGSGGETCPRRPQPTEEPPDRSAERAAHRSPAQDNSRRIPQAVKDEVWKRDGGRCAFIARDGLRCAERGDLEFDHIIPWALGGRSDVTSNIRLLCRAHNQYQSRKVFGDRNAAPQPPEEPA